MPNPASEGHAKLNILVQFAGQKQHNKYVNNSRTLPFLYEGKDLIFYFQTGHLQMKFTILIRRVGVTLQTSLITQEFRR